MKPNQCHIGLLWAQYGPYHFARAEGLARAAAPARVHAIEIASRTRDYAWERSAGDLKLVTLFPDAVAEQLSFWRVFWRARREFRALNLAACFLPSYAPSQSLAALLAAKSLGVRTIMMNETHAGTARSGKWGTAVKRRLLGLFDAALIGGQPQKRYFASLGMHPARIFTGYDAVDNDYFAQRTAVVRQEARHFRSAYELPERYFLSLGRFVEKKNLACLIHAYTGFVAANPTSRTHLVMVGAGQEEAALRTLCVKLKVPVYSKSEAGRGKIQLAPNQDQMPGVHIYGFRQIDENPIFYALADLFILPSLYEEWGLVVNEAMACGLPVVVSEKAGCAEDLLEETSGVSEMASEISAGDLRPRVRQNGFVFDPTSCDQLSRVLGYLDSRPELRAEMGRASRSKVSEFSCQKFGCNGRLAVQAALGNKWEGDIASPAEEIVVTRP